MYAIKWSGAYVVDLSSSKPYTTNVDEAKRWKTRKNAERYLSLKDPSWAADCEIVEVDQLQPVVRDDTCWIGGYAHGDRYVVCPVCGEEVGLRMSWYDSYAKGGPAQVHYGCLSQKRRDEIKKEVESEKSETVGN